MSYLVFKSVRSLVLRVVRKRYDVPRIYPFLSGFRAFFAVSGISGFRCFVRLNWDFAGAPSRTPASTSAKADPSLASSVGRNAKNVPLARSCPAGRVSTSSVRVLRPLTNWGLPSCICQPPTGAPSRTRTCNRRIRSPLLYPLSHGRASYDRFAWFAHRDSVRFGCTSRAPK